MILKLNEGRFFIHKLDKNRLFLLDFKDCDIFESYISEEGKI